MKYIEKELSSLDSEKHIQDTVKIDLYMYKLQQKCVQIAQYSVDRRLLFVYNVKYRT